MKQEIDVSYNQNKLHIQLHSSYTEISFSSTIIDVVVMSDRLFVLLGTKSPESNRNIYCLDISGQQIWQVQDPDNIKPTPIRSESPFTGIRLGQNQELLASNWNSHEYEIDIHHGRIRKATWTK